MYIDVLSYEALARQALESPGRRWIVWAAWCCCYRCCVVVKFDLLLLLCCVAVFLLPLLCCENKIRFPRCCCYRCFDVKFVTLLDVCASSLRMANATLLRLVPILTNYPRGESMRRTLLLLACLPLLHARLWAQKHGSSTLRGPKSPCRDARVASKVVWAALNKHGREKSIKRHVGLKTVDGSDTRCSTSNFRGQAKQAVRRHRRQAHSAHKPLSCCLATSGAFNCVQSHVHLFPHGTCLLSVSNLYLV